MCTFKRKRYLLELDYPMNTPFFSRHPEEDWNTEKNAVFRDPYFLIRHTPGITKIPKLKYSMCIQARNFDISDLCTEKWLQIGLKRGFFSTKVLMVFFCTNELQKKIHYAAFSDSVDTFRHKIFENWLKNDCFMTIETFNTCNY